MLALIEPSYPTSGRRGRPPMAASTMLRISTFQPSISVANCYKEESPRKAGVTVSKVSKVAESGNCPRHHFR
jgi:hypothetical protein